MTEQMDANYPKLTDDAVASLPLSQGRADLLEEIMSTPVRSAVTGRTAHPGWSTDWLVPAAASAVVAGLAMVPLWLGFGGSEPAPVAAGQSIVQASTAPAWGPAATGAYLVVLDSPGWQVESVGLDQYGGSVHYTSGAASFEIGWRPASLYDSYVKDREHIVDPPAPGEPVEVLGRSAQLWAYSPDDHTVIREPELGYSFEIRGQGLSRLDYLDLLDQLRLVDQSGFEASLPPRFVTTGERDAVTREMADGIAEALGPARGLTPLGILEPDFTSDEPDRYSLGADVAGTVACAWLDSYVAGVESGDTDQSSDAAAALATSRQWPVLLEMDARGDYPEVVWSYADDVAAGRDVTGYQDGLGCD